MARSTKVAPVPTGGINVNKGDYVAVLTRCVSRARATNPCPREFRPGASRAEL